MPDTTPTAFDATVNLAGLKLKNPILTASGTFGYGAEFATFGDLASLGGMVVKGVSLERRRGNPLPRIAENTKLVPPASSVSTMRSSLVPFMT